MSLVLGIKTTPPRPTNNLSPLLRDAYTSAHPSATHSMGLDSIRVDAAVFLAALEYVPSRLDHLPATDVSPANKINVTLNGSIFSRTNGCIPSMREPPPSTTRKRHTLYQDSQLLREPSPGTKTIAYYLRYSRNAPDKCL